MSSKGSDPSVQISGSGICVLCSVGPTSGLGWQAVGGEELGRLNALLTAMPQCVE